MKEKTSQSALVWDANFMPTLSLFALQLKAKPINKWFHISNLLVIRYFAFLPVSFEYPWNEII